VSRNPFYLRSGFQSPPEARPVVDLASQSLLSEVWFPIDGRNRGLVRKEGSQSLLSEVWFPIRPKRGPSLTWRASQSLLSEVWFPIQNKAMVLLVRRRNPFYLRSGFQWIGGKTMREMRESQSLLSEVWFPI